jgi:hypothetical protein
MLYAAGAKHLEGFDHNHATATLCERERPFGIQPSLRVDLRCWAYNERCVYE